MAKLGSFTMESIVQDYIQRRIKGEVESSQLDIHEMYRCVIQYHNLIAQDAKIALSSNPKYPREEMALLRSKYEQLKHGDVVIGVSDLLKKVLESLVECDNDIKKFDLKKQ